MSDKGRSFEVSDALARLQAWFASQCDGDWEHGSGLTLTTLDNPGWSLKINIAGTSWSARGFQAIEHHRSEDDWLVCKVTDDKFVAAGGPLNLQEMIEAFLAGTPPHFQN